MIRDRPFQIDFTAKIQSSTPENTLTLKGLLFDDYLSWVNVTAYSMASASEDDFVGVFGLGQRASQDFFYKTGVYSMWTKDIDNPVEDGRLPGKNVYGVHPFYMFKHAKNSYVGVYHNLAQAQDWWITNHWQSGQVDLATVATGGRGDIFVFTSAQKPEDIIAKYHSLVGAPVLVPQWALGWNQCKWGYQNTDQVEASMQGYIDNKIPLDTQWVDIDYMQDYRDFSYQSTDVNGNPAAFNKLPVLISRIHNMNMRFVPIIDAGVSYRPNSDYGTFNRGMQQDIFIKLNGQPFVGKVWPNEACYPDFFHPKAESWWGGELDTFHQSIVFDGLWQDMNEASNFCYGVCSRLQLPTSPVSYKLKYTPTGEDLEV